jgi:predicted ATPase
LLVLDNCEHLLDPCAVLAATLLGACQGLQILATSWEVLGVAGETVWRVPSLSLPLPLQPSPGSRGPGKAQRSSGQRPGDWARLPAAHDEAAAAMLEQSEAVRLFVARARACRQDFVLRANTAATVARICWQLDGLPLAIELAAARVSHLPLEEIAARLDDRLGLLASGPRTVLPRHQTLRAVMDWGHKLLSERERVLFRRLAVFAGGWSLGAAEMVCGGDGIEEQEVLQLLGDLVNKSLVVLENQGGDGRYRLLETVREYAQEHLGLAAEGTALKNRHLAWHVALGEQAELELRGPGQAMRLARLETELDNLRAALTWGRQEESQAAHGERLASLVGRFWQARGYLSEGRHWLSAYLASAVAVSATVRAETLAAAGRLAYYQSDLGQATTRYEASLALYRADGNERGTASAYNGLGLVLVDQGRYEQAACLFEQSLALNRTLQDAWATAGTLNNLGMVAHRQGDYQRSAAWLEESLDLYRQLGDTQGMANTLNTWGVVAMDSGDPSQATTLLEESLALHRELDGAYGMAIALSNLGMLARQGDAYGRAAILLREGLVIFQKLDAEGEISMCLEALALIAGAQGDHEHAARLFGVADAQRQALGAPLPAAERAIHDAAVEAVRSALAEEAFSRSWAAGQAMSLEQAIAVAVEATKRPVAAQSTAAAVKD